MGLFDGDVDKQYFLFSLGNRRFGVPIKEVVKVIQVEKVSFVPLLLDYFLGLILHEGTPIPFISLKKRLGLHGEEKNSVALIIRVGSVGVGGGVGGVGGVGDGGDGGDGGENRGRGMYEGGETMGISIDAGYEVVQLESNPEPLPDKVKGNVKKLFKARALVNDVSTLILNIEALTLLDDYH